jgi:hypothetical protein
MSSVWGMSVSSDAATSLTAVLWGLVAALLLALLGAAVLAWRLKGRPAAEQPPSEAQA